MLAILLFFTLLVALNIYELLNILIVKGICSDIILCIVSICIFGYTAFCAQKDRLEDEEKYKKALKWK